MREGPGKEMNRGRLRGWGSASTASRSRSDWGRQIRSRGAARRWRVGEEGDLAARAVRAFWDRFALTRSWGGRRGLAARVVGGLGGPRPTAYGFRASCGGAGI